MPILPARAARIGNGICVAGYADTGRSRPA
jgi:hypothetical protein